MKKETLKNILGVALLYTALVIGVLLIDWRMGQIEDQQKTTADTVVLNERVK